VFNKFLRPFLKVSECPGDFIERFEAQFRVGQGLPERKCLGIKGIPPPIKCLRASETFLKHN